MKTTRFMLLACITLLSNVCIAQYIFTLDLVQMNDYLGKSCKVRVTEISTGKEVGRKTIAEITSSSFSVELYTLLQGRSYNVDIVVDVNDNGTYDAPPTDHAWRRMVTNATQNVNMTFAPDANFTDTGCPDAFPFSQYNSTWGGKWFNLTFGSTDSIKASFRTTCDSVFGSFMTKGLFGNPQTVMFNFAQAIPEGSQSTDTIKFSLPAPWTGQICIIGERIEADLALTGIQLQFTGTVGAKQLLCLYQVLTGGNPFANGYFYIRELNIISSAPPLEIALEEIEQNFCHGSDHGLLSVTGNGGSAPYTYLWSNGTTAPVTEDLVAGEYCVTVTDADGCTVVSCYAITEPFPITLEVIVFEACAHDCVGLIDVTVSGGQPGYVLFWDNGFIGEDPGNLCVGDYSVNVLDANGCQEHFAFTITAPPDIIFDTIIIEHAMNGQPNGGFDVVVSGSIGPYLYSLDGTAFQTSPLFGNLPAGEYCVYVIDGFGCEKKSEMFEIQNISALAELETQFRWYPNPATLFLYLQADIPLSLDILDVNGNTLRHAEESVLHRVTLEGMVPGLYLLCISDGIDKTYKKLIVL